MGKKKRKEKHLLISSAGITGQKPPQPAQNFATVNIKLRRRVKEAA